METSTYPFTYKGSVPEAINESRNQKKLFMVYISGENEDSVKMDQLTWLDQKVAESISKFCIFLHLREGSVDASQFSAIYPQKSFPNISVIGLNGVLLWHYEGYISVENLIENIDQAWAALHMQEAALTLLTAALASKEREPPIPTTSSLPSEQVISSAPNDPSTSADKPIEESELGPLTVTQQFVEERPSESNSQKYNFMAEEQCSQMDSPNAVPLTDTQQFVEERPSESNSQKYNFMAEEQCSQMDSPNAVKIGRIDGSNSKDNIGEDIHSPHEKMNSATANLGANSNVLVENSTVDEIQAATSAEFKEMMTTLGPVPSQRTTEVEAEISQVETSHAVKSNDVHLNIRMPNGTGLQTKLTLTDTLRSIKTFVDDNIDIVVGSYNLAVPYPRKVFSDEDMTSTLSELGFASRQALIVVLHQPPRSPSSSNDSQIGITGNVSSENAGGYFDRLKGILSYVNPLSYLGGNANSSESGTVTNPGLWHYSPNPSLQSHMSGSGQHLSSQDNQDTASRNSASSSARPRPSRQFGSNVHTLRHDDDPSGDRNVFWNGNSTQFGGDNKK